MTIAEMSKATGYSDYQIRKMIKSGEVESVRITENQRGTGYWDIDPAYIPVLRNRKENYRRADYAPKRRRKRNNDLSKAVRCLKVFNEEHGTNYSYGQATALDII